MNDEGVEDAGISLVQTGVDALEPGSVVGGRYTLERLLGAGGMGAVYLARHQGTERAVALKVLHPQFKTSGMVVARFRQEARVATRVRHPNIVEVLDFGNDGALFYLVMDLLEGESLEALRRREAMLSPARALALLDPLLGALSYVHGLGVVHRDLKPDNIFIARVPGVAEPVPKLLDFGIARAHDAQAVRLTASGVMMGTPLYMAPEQSWGSSDLDARADQWSIAAVLYELLTGRTPYQGETLPALIQQRLSGPPVNPTELVPSLDPRLSGVLLRALEPDRDRRYPTMEALREALAPWLEGPRKEARGWLVDTLDEPIHGPKVPPAAVTPADLPLAQSPLPIPPTPPEEARKEKPESASQAILEATPEATSEAKPTPAEDLVRPSPPWWKSPWMIPTSAVLLVAAIVLPRGSRPGSARPTTPPAAALEQVTLRFDFDPGTAVVTLEGERLGVGHAAVQRPRDGRRFQLRVEAPGYQPYTEVVVASGDVSIGRSLQPLPTPAATPRAPHGAPAPSPPRISMPPRAPGGPRPPAGTPDRAWPPGT